MVKQKAKGAEIFSLKCTKFEIANVRLILDFENELSSSKLFFWNECHYLKSPCCKKIGILFLCKSLDENIYYRNNINFPPNETIHLTQF